MTEFPDIEGHRKDFNDRFNREICLKKEVEKDPVVLRYCSSIIDDKLEKQYDINRRINYKLKGNIDDLQDVFSKIDSHSSPEELQKAEMTVQKEIKSKLIPLLGSLFKEIYKNFVLSYIKQNLILKPYKKQEPDLNQSSKEKKLKEVDEIINYREKDFFF